MGKMEADVSSVLKELEKKEQMESLHYLVDKLPEFVSTVKVMEDKLTFLVDSLSDQQSLRTIVEETERKVAKLRINEEHLAALIELVHMLPRLLPVMKNVEDIALFVEDVVGDEKTVESLIEGVNEVIPIREGTEIIEETNQHFKESKDMSPVSIFGLMKMLKDPAIQNSLKYVQSLLAVINKRS